MHHPEAWGRYHRRLRIHGTSESSPYLHAIQVEDPRVEADPERLQGRFLEAEDSRKNALLERVGGREGTWSRTRKPYSRFTRLRFSLRCRRAKVHDEIRKHQLVLDLHLHQVPRESPHMTCACGVTMSSQNLQVMFGKYPGRAK